MRFEPKPASSAAPSPSESGDITTAPLRLLKTGFMEQYNGWFPWMTGRIGYIFGTLAHLLYGIITDASTSEKVSREKYEIPLGWVTFEPTPASTAAPNPSESGALAYQNYTISDGPFREIKHIIVLWHLFFNKRSGALVLTLMGKALPSKPVWASVMILGRNSYFRLTLVYSCLSYEMLSRSER